MKDLQRDRLVTRCLSSIDLVMMGSELTWHRLPSCSNCFNNCSSRSHLWKRSVWSRQTPSGLSLARTSPNRIERERDKCWKRSLSMGKGREMATSENRADRSIERKLSHGMSQTIDSLRVHRSECWIDFGIDWWCQGSSTPRSQEKKSAGSSEKRFHPNRSKGERPTGGIFCVHCDCAGRVDRSERKAFSLWSVQICCRSTRCKGNCGMNGLMDMWGCCFQYSIQSPFFIRCEEKIEEIFFSFRFAMVRFNLNPFENDFNWNGRVEMPLLVIDRSSFSSRTSIVPSPWPVSLAMCAFIQIYINEDHRGQNKTKQTISSIECGFLAHVLACRNSATEWFFCPSIEEKTLFEEWNQVLRDAILVCSVEIVSWMRRTFLLLHVDLIRRESHSSTDHGSTLVDLCKEICLDLSCRIWDPIDVRWLFVERTWTTTSPKASVLQGIDQERWKRRSHFSQSECLPSESFAFDLLDQQEHWSIDLSLRLFDRLWSALRQGQWRFSSATIEHSVLAEEVDRHIIPSLSPPCFLRIRGGDPTIDRLDFRSSLCSVCSPHCTLPSASVTHSVQSVLSARQASLPPEVDACSTTHCDLNTRQWCCLILFLP